MKNIMLVLLTLVVMDRINFSFTTLFKIYDTQTKTILYVTEKDTIGASSITAVRL